MKILLVNNSDQDGGAARAALRLLQGLHSYPGSTSMLVQSKHSSCPSIIGPKASSGISQVFSGSRLVLDQLPLKFIKADTKPKFSPQWIPENIPKKVKQFAPDIINLHWINSGFVKIESLAQLGKPIVWTLHDMWAFTGGCHYNQDCQFYKKACGSCPQLDSQKERDLSRWVWQRKFKAWRDLDITVVSPSKWLADCARSSPLLQNNRIEVIPNGIDTNLYRPLNKQFARNVLGLPQDKRLILFGALSATSDTRKGFHLLQPALKMLKNSYPGEAIELVVFGASQPENPPDLSFKAHYLGTFKDDISLVLAYSAADVFVLPSVQDNLPNTVLEALACGLPCTAFKVGGVSDMIKHKQNGFLAEPFSSEQIAEGICWVLANQDTYNFLTKNARETVKAEFSIQIQANKYRNLFQEISLEKTV
jgi:glycosyltransferase involved in cell wall biosynthesis